MVVLKELQSGFLTHREAGARLGLSSRQIRRLLKRLDRQGIEGIKAHHKSGNRAFTIEFIVYWLLATVEN